MVATNTNSKDFFFILMKTTEKIEKEINDDPSTQMMTDVRI